MPKAVSYAQWFLEPYCIGQKLRALRNQKRMTLSRLAAETGLSTTLLSKLETDRMVPTLPTLATINKVYGVGLGYFFAEPARHALSITRKAHLQGAGRSVETVKVMPLNPAHDDPGTPSAVRDEASPSRPRVRPVAQMMEFPAGGAATPIESFHEANGVIYVLEGRLQLSAGGMLEVLETGDCACLESDMAFAWSAVGKHRCRVLAVLTREG